MDLILDCPQPTGVFRPVYGPDGKPALCVRRDPANPLMPLAWNKPAMCEWPAPHANGYAVEEPGFSKTGEITRMDATGLTVGTETLHYVDAAALVWIVNGGHKTVTASVEVTGFGAEADRVRGYVGVMCRKWFPAAGRFGWEEVAYVPEHAGGGVGIAVGEPVTLGVWHRYVLRLRVLAYDITGTEYPAGTASLNLSYV